MTKLRQFDAKEHGLKNRDQEFVAGAFAAEKPGLQRNTAAGDYLQQKVGILQQIIVGCRKLQKFEKIMMFDHYPTPDSILEMVIDMCGYVLWKS